MAKPSLCGTVSVTVIALPKMFCFDCLFIIFFLKLKRKIFKMMPCHASLGNLFIQSLFLNE